MGFFSLKETCVICGKTADLTRSNTSIGPVCKDCIDKLVKQGINALNIKKYEISQLRELCRIAEEKANYEMSAYGQLEQRIVNNPSISLKEGEVCFYQKKASAFHQKNVVTGTKSNGVGVSLRIAKGLSVRTGGGGSTTIRENVNEYFDGTLYITNMRMILLAPKYGFDVMIPKITSISQRKDGLQIFVGSKCHSVYTNDVKNIIALLGLMNSAYANQPKESKPTSKKSNTVNTAQELREYKKLLDEGIISQEEFDAKKKQLLGL